MMKPDLANEKTGMLNLKTRSWYFFEHHSSNLELASTNDETTSVHSGGGGDTTPVLERKAVRFLSRDNSMGMDDKIPYLTNIQTMSDDNMYLLQELSDLQTNFNKLLRSLVLMYKLERKDSTTDTDTVDSSNTLKEEPTGDEELLNWLRNLNVPEPDIAKFCEHYCTYDDVINLFELEDLKDMKISVGPRTRIWTNIRKIRESVNEGPTEEVR